MDLWQPPAFDNWTLNTRTLLNPESSGSGVYLLQLLAPSTSSWLAGDLVEVMPRNSCGAVADFLNMSCCGYENPYAFNVADIAIFAGAAGLVLFTGSDARPPAKPRKPRGKTS